MSVRKYAVGDRVVRRDGKVGEVIQVQSDPYPYLVDFGNRWAACWMSGLDLEPAPSPWADAVVAPRCRAPFCGRAGISQRVFGVTGVVVCEQPACVAWGELRSGELLDSYEWREHAARMRRGDCQPRQEARKVDGDFATIEEHIAAWKAGGRRWAKVEGFNVDAVQAERDADHAEQARFDAVAAMLAGDPVQAARCGVPAEIEEPTTCPTCGAVRK